MENGVPPHFHRLDRISEKDLVPDDTVLSDLPESGLPGQRVIVQSGTTFRFYQYLDGDWRELGGGAEGTLFVTNFENHNRFQEAGGGSSNADTTQYGLIFTTGSSVANRRRAWWYLGRSASFKIFAGNPTFGVQFVPSQIADGSGQGHFFAGLGTLEADGTTGIDFTPKHVGFKLIKNADTPTLYATQSDGTTESDELLTTVQQSDSVEATVTIGDDAVTYRWQINGGGWETTSLSTNIPDPTTNSVIVTFATSNVNTAFDYEFHLGSAFYKR